METLLKSEEAAKRLNVSLSTVRSWIFYKRIPAVRLGAAVRIRESDIERIVEKGLPRSGS